MQVGPACDESHIDPITLPRLPESITQHYRDLVDECRAEDPNERPATWRLLERFPSTSDPESSQTEASEHKSMGVSSLRKNIVRAIICDRCQKTVQAPFLQCDICHVGDYDIRLACYDGVRIVMKGTICWWN